MNKEAYTLKELEALEQIFKSVRNECANSNSFKEEIILPDKILQIKAINFESFRFELISMEMNLNKKEIVFKYQMNPWADTVNKMHGGNANSKDLAERFSAWTALIKRYEKLDFYDPILSSYESEFFEYFKIDEEDANFKPFNLDQQRALIRFLEDAINLPNKNEANEAEIILMIEETLNNVTKESKNKVMHRISKIFAKSRKTSLKLFKDLIDVSKKEVLKELFWSGYEKIGEISSSINNLLN